MRCLVAWLLLSAAHVYGQFALQNPGEPLSLNGEWRFQRGDDAAWASPSYDDRAWNKLLIPGPGHQPGAGLYWYRLRIENRLGRPTDGLWISLPALAPSYEVFANGVRVGSFGPTPGEKDGLLRPRIAAFALPVAAGDIQLAIRAAWTVPPTPLLVAPEWNQPTAWLGTRAIVEGQVAKAERDALQRQQLFAFLNTAAFAAGLVLLTVPVRRREASEYFFAGGYLVTGAVIRWVQAWIPMPTSTVGVTLIAHTTLLLLLVTAWMGFVGRTFSPAHTGRLLRTGGTVWFAWAAAGSAIWTWRPEWLGAWQFYLLITYAVGIAVAFFSAQWRSPGNLALKFATGLFVVSALGGALASSAPVLAPLAAPELRAIAVLALGFSMARLLNRRSRRQEEDRQRLQQEINAAAEIQNLLLPAAALHHGDLDIQTASIPAAEVGGDFYQALRFADGASVAILGDVSGKGLRAAMIVSVAIGAIQRNGSSSPAAILTDINQALCGRVGGGFATCCCIRCDAEGRVSLASAGHPSPLMGGREIEVEPGLPLGVVPEAAYQEGALQLEPGQQLVLVSDGVLEAANAQAELFGFDRTAAMSARTAAEIAEAARAWGQNDDITVVTVRRKA